MPSALPCPKRVQAPGFIRNNQKNLLRDAQRERASLFESSVFRQESFYLLPFQY